MVTHLLNRASQETEIASDLRIGDRKYQRAKPQNYSWAAFNRIPATKKECALSPFYYHELRGPQTRRDTRGGLEKRRIGRDVCLIAQEISSDCVLHSAESR